MQGLKRFPPNPESNWGPKPRAKRRDTDLNDSEESNPKKQKRKAKNSEKAKPDLKQFACKKFLAGTCERSEEECVYSHDKDKVGRSKANGDNDNEEGQSVKKEAQNVTSVDSIL